MIEAIFGIAKECWLVFKEAAPFVLFGFFAAGLLKVLIPEKTIVKHLGGNGFRSVFKASLFGVPLPLCSCGVIPVAVGLRKQGASKGATASFLVSVPETGVDSVAITWALLDPLMTVIRPVSAFITALATGSLINLLPEQKGTSKPDTTISCCSANSDSSKQSSPKIPLLHRLKDGVIYAFTDLLKDIGGWLLLGILIAGVISYFVPIDFVDRYLGGEYSSLLIMLIIGIPLYICASASTPIAAALVLKGLSPGAALVFLARWPSNKCCDHDRCRQTPGQGNDRCLCRRYYHLFVGLRLARQPDLCMVVYRCTRLGFPCRAWGRFVDLLNFSVRSDWAFALELSSEWKNGKRGLWCYQSAWGWLTGFLTWQFASFGIKSLIQRFLFILSH